MYSFEDKTPELLGENIFISAEATVIGAVVIENNVCILPHAVIRADNHTIYIREGANIQDGAVLHTDAGITLEIGKNVTIAHKAVVHGCKIGDGSVVGIGAIVLNNAVVGKNCFIAANSLILENTVIPDGSLVMGSPGKIKKQFTEIEIKKMQLYSKHYMEKIARFKKSLIKI